MNKKLFVDLEKIYELQSGRNPHQAAALYGGQFDELRALTDNKISFMDIINADVGYKVASEIHKPIVVFTYKGDVVYAAYDDGRLDVSKFQNLRYWTLSYSGEGGNGFLHFEKAGIFPESIFAPTFSEYALGVIEKNQLKAAVVPVQTRAFLEIYPTKMGYLVSEEDDLRDDIHLADDDEILAYAVMKHSKSWTLVAVQNGETEYIFSFNYPEEIDKYVESIPEDAVVATDYPLEQFEPLMKFKTAILPGTNLEEVPQNFKLTKYEHMRI